MATAHYPLANDTDGNPLAVPAEAVAWRVRRGGGRRGRPRVVFDGETGRQLEIPLAATVEDLIERGCPPGRYRLEAVSADGRLIAGVVGVTEIATEGATEYDGSDGDEEIDGASDRKLRLRMLRTIERQSDTMCRAVEAMASAFAPVRSVGPMMVDASDGGGGVAMQPDKLVETVGTVVKSVADAWRLGGGSTGGTP